MTDPGDRRRGRDDRRPAHAARGLTALVNNAGSAHTGPLEFVRRSTTSPQLEVNLIGQLAVTQAMLPLLRQARRTARSST